LPSGKYDAAEPLYLRAVDIHERVQGKCHPDTATALNYLAGLLKVKGAPPPSDVTCQCHAWNAVTCSAAIASYCAEALAR
jgi:hypothetical protein